MLKLPLPSFLTLLHVIPPKYIKTNATIFKNLSVCNYRPANFVFLYGQDKNSEKFELNEACNILGHNQYDKKKKTVIYIHGYKEGLKKGSTVHIMNAYAERNDLNFIVLDWTKEADEKLYRHAVRNANHLCHQIVEVLINMIEEGMDITKLHLVGHSLGGQMSGLIGREVFNKTDKISKVSRITALDPAFPLFMLCKSKYHVNKEDAEFVDIIHTDAYIYGSPCSSGTADFWPNGGITLQPGCPKRDYKILSEKDLCSHLRSWHFWAESVANKGPLKFEAVQAKSWSNFKAGQLDTNKMILMGHDCPTNIKGDFFLITNSNHPFAMGKKGTVYRNKKTEDAK